MKIDIILINYIITENDAIFIMKYLFEVNSTFCKPIYMYCDENISVEEFIEDVTVNIEIRTDYIRDDIIDIFVQNLSGLMSIPRLKVPIKEFMKKNSDYFRQWAGSLERNIHKIYIMDKHYLKNPKINKVETAVVEPTINVKQIIKFLIPI